MTIFIDADAYIALYKKDDALHNRAHRLLATLTRNQTAPHIITSWEVIDEAATKLSYTCSKQLAILLIGDITDSETTVVFPTPKVCMETIGVFTSFLSKRISLTDCSNIVICKQMKIDAIFSFDKIYTKNGIALLEDVLVK